MFDYKNVMRNPIFNNICRRDFLSLMGISVAGPLLSSCATLEKIDKGLYNVHQSATEKDLITGERAIGFTSRAEQIKKGNAAMNEVISKYSRLNEQVDRRAYSRLQRIFARVHTVSHYAHESWRVLLLPEDDFNAFVTGGTYVAVHKGLMGELQDDAEVAAVVGHEIGHVVANHAFEKQSQLIQLIEQEKTGRGFGFAYNALQEEEADEVGVVYAALAGYNPGAISAVWNRFTQYDDWSWFRTHPANTDRARATRILGRKATSYYIPGSINPQHRKLSRCNDFWCNR